MAKTVSSSNPLASIPLANRQLKQRLLGVSAGEPGARTTTFWLEAPGPIIVLSFDRGTEGVVERVLEANPSKEIRIKEFDWIPDMDGNFSQDLAVDIRDQFIETYKLALKHGRTVIVDKETDLWSVVRYAEWGAPTVGQQKNYDAVNARMRAIVDAAKPTDCNVGFLDGMEDEWGAVTKASGQQGAAKIGRRRAGWDHLERAVHFSLVHTGRNERNWAITVGKMRGPGNPSMADTTLSYAECSSWVEFAGMMFPDSLPSDWE